MMRVGTNKCFKFKKNSQICKTQHVSQYEFIEEEGKAGYDAKLNLAELEIDAEAISYSSPLQFPQHQQDQSISEWNYVEAKDSENNYEQHSPKRRKTDYKESIYNQTLKNVPGNFINPRKTVYKMNKGRVIGMMDEWKMKKVMATSPKETFREKFQLKIHDRSISRSPFKQTNRFQCLKQIQMMFRDEKEDISRKESLKSMMVGPRTLYNSEKGQSMDSLSVDRLHGIHQSVSNKFDLIFRVHRYKKTPMFSCVEDRRKRMSLDAKHIELIMGP